MTNVVFRIVRLKAKKKKPCCLADCCQTVDMLKPITKRQVSIRLTLVKLNLFGQSCSLLTFCNDSDLNMFSFLPLHSPDSPSLSSLLSPPLAPLNLLSLTHHQTSHSPARGTACCIAGAHGAMISGRITSRRQPERERGWIVSNPSLGLTHSSHTADEIHGSLTWWNVAANPNIYLFILFSQKKQCLSKSPCTAVFCLSRRIYTF